MKNIKKKWNDFIKSPRKQIKVILISIFLSMFILNLFTPLIADDYSYSFGLDGKLQNITDIIKYQIDHYFTWGGRSISHTIAQIFLLLPKTFFNIANAMVYTLFVWLMYDLTKNKKEESPLSLIAINLAIWFFQPVFGQTCIWLIGSCNYLWTTTIILLFIKQYVEKDSKKNSKLRIILMLLLGLIAGWTNENTSFGLLVVIAGMLTYQKVKEKNKKIEKWQIGGFIGAIAGFIILIAAPGNYVRNSMAQLGDDTFIIIKIIRRALDYTQATEKFILPLIIISIVLISILLYKKKKVKIEVPIYLTAAFFTIYSMVLSPQFPERAWFGIITFMLMAIMIMINDIIKLNRLFKFIYIDVIIIGLVLFTIQYVESARDIRALQNIWNDRIEYIESEKEKGNKEITIDVYWCSTSKCPNYGLSDIFEEKEKWPNNDIARYFEIDSIAARKQDEGNE